MRPIITFLLTLFLAFATTNVAHADFIIDLQIVSYCNDDGTQCADAQLDESLFADIWAQADLTINILPTVQFSLSSLAVIGDFDSGLDQHRNVVISALGGPLSSTLYLGVARDSTAPPQAGLSFFDFPYGIIDGSQTSSDLFLRTWNASHQIGHMLGLVHNGAGNDLPPTGLMAPIFSSSYELFPLNIQVIQQSALTIQVAQEVPEPSTFALFSLGLLAVGLARRRRRPVLGLLT